MLREKARYFGERLGVEAADFDASVGWLERSKARHNIAFKKVSGEANSVDRNDDAFKAWESCLQTILQTYSADDIFNADETAIFFRAMPDKTFEFKSVDCHGGKVNKERLTALVCSNMTGSEKLPLLVIGKSKKPRCFKQAKSLPTQYRANTKAWMTGELFSEWLKKVDDQMARKKRNVAMVIDNCAAHPDIKSLKAVKLVFLPPNTTSITQPMDQGVIKNLKVFYRKQLLAKKITAIDTDQDLKVSVLDALRMLRQAWESVTPLTISNCFKHAGFTATDATEVNYALDEDPNDYISLARLMRIFKAESNVTMDDYVNIDSMLPSHFICTDDDSETELIENRRNKESHVSDSSDDESEPVKPVNLNEAASACEILQKFIESQDGKGVQTFFNQVRRFVTKKQFTKTCANQMNITNFFSKT